MRASFPQASRSRFRFCGVSPYIPPRDLAEQRLVLGRVLSGRVVRGSTGERLAEAIRSRLGVPHVLLLNRARSAVEVALRALEVGAGDDVVLPAYLCGAVLEPILNVRARPVFADVGDDLHVTARAIELALTPKTRCVIVPHLFGNTAPIDAIEELLRGSGIALLDDAAQSFGARVGGRPVGAFGSCGVVGCGPGKSLVGPAGGALITSDAAFFERVLTIPLQTEGWATVMRRTLAFWAWARGRRFTLAFKDLSDSTLAQLKEGGSQVSRMSNLEAALFLHRLERHPALSSERRACARRIVSRLTGHEERCLTDLSDDALALRIAVRLPAGGPTVEAATAALARVGVECGENYTPLYRLLDLPGSAALSVTEERRKRIVLLPVSDKLFSRRRWPVIRQLWPPPSGEV